MEQPDRNGVVIAFARPGDFDDAVLMAANAEAHGIHLGRRSLCADLARISGITALQQNFVGDGLSRTAALENSSERESAGAPRDDRFRDEKGAGHSAGRYSSN
jgi:hypothetical protein